MKGSSIYKGEPKIIYVNKAAMCNENPKRGIKYSLEITLVQ
jgi:hypothetical protein